MLDCTACNSLEELNSLLDLYGKKPPRLLISKQVADNINNLIERHYDVLSIRKNQKLHWRSIPCEVA